MTDPIAEMRSATGLDIFQRRDDEPGGFKFVIPGVMIGANDVKVDFDREEKDWVLTHHYAGRTWTGHGGSLIGAYLDLIADRCGLHEESEQ